MTNTNLLRARIIERGYTQTDVANSLGMSVASLNKRLNNQSQFRADEMWALKKLLGLKKLEPYFFDEEVNQ